MSDEIENGLLDFPPIEEDEAEDLSPNVDYSDLVVYSRDWTIETIVSQVSQGNILLNPKFQRRSAWTDSRRSSLIESLIIGVPVPQVVLAEEQGKKGKFLVIDGKQRLHAIAGFAQTGLGFWNSPKLAKLETRIDLNGLTFADLKEKYTDEFNILTNADMRCTIISNYKSLDVLYDIFYRLNTGSVSLSTQELRQVFYRGHFADYLIEITDQDHPIRRILRIKGPDARLKDMEIILRHFAMTFFAERYDGDLRRFLDLAMIEIGQNWNSWKSTIEDEFKRFNIAIETLEKVLEPKNVGKKFINGEWQTRLNKVLFELQVYFFSKLSSDLTGNEMKNNAFVDQFKSIFQDADFRSSVESSTKNTERVWYRYKLFGGLIENVYGVTLTPPIPH